MHKAVEYLLKSGEKSLKKYALEESHQYFLEAFDLLASKLDRTEEENGLLIDLITEWAYVYYYRGDFRGLGDLLRAHEEWAESLEDQAKLGMFYAWLGFSLHCREQLNESYRFLCKALKLGEETGSQRVIAYACTWLTWTCTELGLLEDAVLFGESALEGFKLLESEPYIYFKAKGGLSIAYWLRGEKKKLVEAGKELLSFGQRHANIRSMVMGHLSMGMSHVVSGDYPAAIECFQRAIKVSADPFYFQFSRVFLGFGYLYGGQYEQAEEAFYPVQEFSQAFGVEILGTMAKACLGIASMTKGDLSRGMKILEACQRVAQDKERKYFCSMLEFILGEVYLQILQKSAPIRLSTMARNIGFLVRNVPFAGQKSEAHFNKLIEVANDMGAHGMLGPAYLDLGLLYEEKGRPGKAKECFSKAIELFERIEAETYLKQAKEALASIG